MKVYLIFLLSFFSWPFAASNEDILSLKLYNSTFQIAKVLEKENEDEEVKSWGSAVLINKKENTYYLLTSAHVILDYVCSVESPNLKRCEDKENENYPSVLTHPELDLYYGLDDYLWFEELDLAVLKVEVDQKDEEGIYSFEPLKLSPAKSSRKAIENHLDEIYAAGYPEALGNDRWANIFLTKGVINAFITSDSDLKETAGYDLVHDAVIKEGMSGGSLVNRKGNLIAINGLLESSKADSQSSCYFSWTCFLHDHREIDLDIGKFSYAITIEKFIEYSLTDTERLLFDDKSMKDFLPKLKREEFSIFYEWLIENYPESIKDINLYMD
jgi:hypothetical protein